MTFAAPHQAVSLAQDPSQYTYTYLWYILECINMFVCKRNSSAFGNFSCTSLIWNQLRSALIVKVTHASVHSHTLIHIQICINYIYLTTHSLFHSFVGDTQVCALSSLFLCNRSTFFSSRPTRPRGRSGTSANKRSMAIKYLQQNVEKGE